MTQIVTVDIGGTHARFAIATCEDAAITLGQTVTLKTGDYPGLHEAWDDFCEQAGCDVHSNAAIAIAGPVTGGQVRMTNNSWVLETGAIDAQLGVERAVVLNDFAAVAHAVAQADAGDLAHICGPDLPLPETGTISVVGPGTGLGVAMVHREAGAYHVLPTEGGHVDFAPVDGFEDKLMARLRADYEVVCVEHVTAGPGIMPIYLTLCEQAATPPQFESDRDIWQAALAGSDATASAALERFIMALGSASGSFALAHGAGALVLAGGLGARLAKRLPQSRFHERFCHKGPYRGLMAQLPVKMIMLPEPGLYGAAAAFLQHYGAD